MPLVKSEYACPRCKRESGQSSQICANAGELVCSVNGQHKWNDTMSFFSENPTMEFKVAPAQFAPQKNLTPFSLSIPIEIKDALDKKYGDKTSATVAGLLMQMVEGEIMIVPELDMERISGPNGLGKKPRNSSELYGMIFALKQEIADAKSTAEAATLDLQAYRGMAPGRVVVDLSDQYGEAKARAANSEPPLPLELWVSSKIRDGIRDNWF